MEHKLAKVGVEGSNPFARSKNHRNINQLERLVLFVSRKPLFGEASGKHGRRFRGLSAVASEHRHARGRFVGPVGPHWSLLK
jgi:hypothetical protein